MQTEKDSIALRLFWSILVWPTSTCLSLKSTSPSITRQNLQATFSFRAITRFGTLISRGEMTWLAFATSLSSYLKATTPGLTRLQRANLWLHKSEELGLNKHLRVFALITRCHYYHSLKKFGRLNSKRSLIMRSSSSTLSAFCCTRTSFQTWSLTGQNSPQRVCWHVTSAMKFTDQVRRKLKETRQENSGQPMLTTV